MNAPTALDTATRIQAHFETLNAHPVTGSFPGLSGASWDSGRGEARFGVVNVRLHSALQAIEATQRRPHVNRADIQQVLTTRLNAHGPLFVFGMALSIRRPDTTGPADKGETIEVPQAYAPALRTALEAWRNGEPGRLSFYASSGRPGTMTFISAQPLADQIQIARLDWTSGTTNAQPRPGPYLLHLPLYEDLEHTSEHPLITRLAHHLKMLATLGSPTGTPDDQEIGAAEKASYRDMAALMAESALRLKNDLQQWEGADTQIRYDHAPGRPALYQHGLNAEVIVDRISAWTLPMPEQYRPETPRPGTTVTIRPYRQFASIELTAENGTQRHLPTEFIVLLDRMLRDCTPDPERADTSADRPPSTTAGGRPVLNFRQPYPKNSVHPVPYHTPQPGVRLRAEHLGEGWMKITEFRHRAPDGLTFSPCEFILSPRETRTLARACHTATRLYLQHEPEQQPSTETT